MSTRDDVSEAIFELAWGVRDLQRRAERQYQAVVGAILCTGSREVVRIRPIG